MPGLLLLLAAVGVVVAGVHWPALSARAFTFDDHQYLTHNHLVRHPSWASARQIVTEVFNPSTVHGYYQPLTMLSLMLDWARGGRTDNLRPFHQTSLVLHVLNTLLVVVLLHQLFGRPVVAALLGLLFGLHPMTVEPVAWLSERKTLLATFFTLASIILYVRWTRRPKWGLYAAALTAFILALLAKPTSTPLPVLLLLLDAWPLRRLSWRGVLEKVPFFLVAGISAVVTVVSQGRTAALAMPHQYAPGWIPLTIAHNIVFYLAKIIWPVPLSPHYPFPRPLDLSAPMVLAGVIGTPLLLLGLLLSLRWTRALAVGWLFFFVAIFPTLGVIGFTQVIASDKYAYLPATGLLLVLAWAAGHVWASSYRTTAARAGLAAGLLLLSAVAGGRTRHQLAYWQDTETLCRHMIRVAPRAAVLHTDLGDELTRQGRIDEAVASFRRALELDPNWYDAHNGLGMALLRRNRPADAIRHFDFATAINPQRGAAFAGRGAALVQMDRLDDAFGAFQQSLQLDPHFADAHANMGAILARRGDLDGAVRHYEEALRLQPELARTHFNLAVALSRMGRLESAAERFRQATRLEPSYIPAHGGLGEVLMLLGRVDEAISVYETALRIAPHDPRLRAALAEAQSRRSSSAPSSP